MLNSRNYVRDERVLNSGEEISQATMDEMKDPSCKVYYHQVKGAITHMPDGAQLTFAGGMFATTNIYVQEHLDKIANKRGSMVYTKDEVRKQIQKDIQGAALTAMVQPGDQMGENQTPDLTKQLDPGTLVSHSKDTSASLLLKPGSVAAPKQS